MERRVTVNDRIDRLELEPPEGLDPLQGDEGAVGEPEVPLTLGPCLYLGPNGQRCPAGAVEGGYCAKHHPDPDLRPSGTNYTRVVVASVALVVIIWPYVVEAARELARWLAARQ